MKRGDRVTNGHWFGQVLAVHLAWAWVEPHYTLDADGEKIPYTFSDGPLTFYRVDLQRTEE